MYYYVKVYERNQFEYDNGINSICLYKCSLLNITTLNQTFFVFDVFPIGDIYITVIARVIKKNNFEENIVAYTPLRVVNGKEEKCGYRYTVIKCLYLIVVSGVGGMICVGVVLYVYKVVRKKQVDIMYRGFEKGKGGMTKGVPRNLSWVIEKDNYV